MSDVRRPVLRYHGGKWMLAPWIIGHFPKHKVYVEPYAGGASILMRKPRSYAEVYNDLASEVVNVFRVLRDPMKAEDLRRRIELTPFAREEFVATYEAVEDDVEAARRTIARSMMGFGSDGTLATRPTGFRANSNRSGTTPARDWVNYPSAIPAFVERLQGVIIEQRPAIRVIEHHDATDTLHYVDPPYLHSTRASEKMYDVEMTDEDHRELAAVLRGLKGMIVLSGYPSPLYEQLYGGWHRVEREALADGARPRTEVLWLNTAAAQSLPAPRLIA